MDVDLPSLETLKSYYQQLKSEIRKYNHYYYVLAHPLISDAAYDELYRKLIAFEDDYATYMDTRHSPTSKIGADLTKHLSTRTHIAPMLSLANAWQEDDLLRFSEKMAAAGVQSLICEPKLDGIAVSLFYQRGCLIYAATRGDGSEGDDITQNIQYLESIPVHLQGQQLPSELYLRGEVVLPLKGFAEINQALSMQQQKTFSNPRNTVAGLLRQLQPNIHFLQQFHFYAYGLLQSHNQAHLDDLEQLRALGFPIIEYYQETPNDIQALCAYAQHIQDSVLPYQIDGVVYKVNDLRLRESLGSTSTSPKWAIAYKSVNMTFTTHIKAITFQMGRTGTLTPVALVKPLLIDGVTVTKVSLHNIHYLITHQIGVGNEVFIKRAGGVIPTIVTNIPRLDQPCVLPSTCMFCGNHLTILSKRLWCNAGLACMAQAKKRIAFFASKSCFNIEGLSHHIINLLYDTGHIQSPVELFALKEKDLLTLPKFGEKKAHNICQAIACSKQITFARLIHSLCIDGVGVVGAQVLAQHFDSLMALSVASMETLLQLKGIGPELAQALVAFFNQDNHQIYLTKLLPCILIQYG
jgi:DNA ligase (NAD+)